MTGAGPYGRAVIEHFRRPRNYGSMPNASAVAEGTNPLCGDRVRLALAIDDAGERIEDARFTANACAICIASASLLTERIRGMAPEAAMQLTQDDVVAQLGSEVPAARRRCAVLPLEALRCALTSAVEGGARLSRGTVAAMLLAAGGARRFGDQKLLSWVPNVDGSRVPLVRQSAVALQRGGADRVLVVLGREGELVRECLTGLDLQFVANDAFANGMSTSVIAGVRRAIELWPDAAGLLIALGDQPLPNERILPGLMDAFAAAKPVIVAPRYRGARGNPVIFSRELVPELLAIEGDEGARRVIERDPTRIVYVDFDFPPPLDVDTVEDLARLGRELGNGSFR